MSSKYRGAFLNILTCFSSKRKASNVSLSRTTANVCSDAGHTDKEPSLRISKQSFDADSTATNIHSKKCYYNNSKNHLLVPEASRDMISNNEQHYRSRDVNSVSFVRISPEGRLDDVLEQDGCLDDKDHCHFHRNATNNTSENNDLEKKNLIVCMSEKNNKADGLVEFKNCLSLNNDRSSGKCANESVV